MRKVAVVFGGKSCENEISVLTGLFVIKLLEGSAYTPVAVYVHTDGKLYCSDKLKDLETFRAGKAQKCERAIFYGKAVYAVQPQKKKMKKLTDIDVVLNCCHGGLGEGGGVSALAAWNGIPLASPELTSSGIFLDKSVTKIALKGLGVPVLDYLRVNEKDYEKRGAFLLKSIASRLKYPVIIKPARLGSSIGIAVANDEEEAKRAIQEGFALDSRLIIEKYLPQKTDVNCAAYALHGQIFVSEPERAFGVGVYSFEEKYIKRRSELHVGAEKSGRGGGVSGELREKIRSLTKMVYKRMNLQGLVRMDFLVSGGKPYLCEVNTVPGSLAYYLFCDRMVEARQLFCDLLADAIERAADEEKTLVHTGILNGVTWKRK